MVQEMVQNGVTLVHSTYGSGYSAFSDLSGVIGVGQVDGNNYYGVYSPPWDSNVDCSAPCMNIIRLQANNSCSEGTGNTSFSHHW